MASTEMASLLDHYIRAEQRLPMSIDQMQRVHSFYSVETKTIYLLPDWTGRTPAELSVLVHEMVHHLQNLSRATFQCPEALERLAYEAQDKWLNLYGHSLLSDFEMDRTSVAVATACTP